MAEAVVRVALEKLSSLAGSELGLFLGFDGHKKKLESKFTAIKATLEDAEERQFSDRSIKDWLRKLKDAAYELDDIMDECATEALELKYKGVKMQSPRLLLTHAAFRRKIAKKMKRISERLDEIAEEKNKFHLTETAPERRRRDVTEGRQTSSIISEPQVYGRKEDKDQIISFLIADASHSEDLSVYPILGQGGLGKTTLAQLIFNHEEVVNHFELQLWVCVSDDFSPKRMAKAIIQAASGDASGDLDLEPLHRRLQDLLKGKRFLLVLDDVWDDDQKNWESLKSVLACGAKGSSILVTTRLSKVAEIMGTITHPHVLSMLPDNDCWELFKRQAFGPNEVEEVELEDIGKEIVKKCRGVPLAAKALGGLLRFRRKKNEWLNVKESNFLELSHNENSILPVLRLSYLNLPIKLRQCFACCAIFPKDEIIEKQYLIELWMANGFISSIERLHAEDVGDGVWNELYWRSFFQDIMTDEFGNVTSFKMHDLVHDLAQSVAEDICCITHDNDVTTLPERIHHISDHSRGSKLDSIQLHQVKSLRTYILRDHFAGQLPPHVLKCYSLRVLHCEGREELSSSIGDLKHLRYLNLSWGDFKTLPESLCELWNLQILKLDYCRFLQKLPNSLMRLKALQQLSLKGYNSLSSLPPHIGKLTFLRILSKYFVGKKRGFHLAEMGPLKLKGDLEINHLERVKSVKDAKEANMLSKQLNELCLSWDRNDEEWELQENVEEIVEVLQPDTQQLESLSVEGYKGAHFPQWMSSSPSLKRLSLKNLPNLIRLSREDGENMFPRLSKLTIDECPTKLLNVSAGFQCLTRLEELFIFRCREVEGLHEALQHMTALKSLILESLPKLESLLDCFGNLPLLQRLELRDLPKLESLPDCFGNLPLLQSLSLESLPKLESLPDCFGNLPSLQSLTLWNLPKLESLPGCFGNLPSLQSLSLRDLPKLESLSDCFGNLPLLHSLYLWNLPKLESLPDCFGNLPSLQSLYLIDLPKLESLPDCFGNLPLLRELTFRNCSKLRCLPTSLSLTSSLKTLYIGSCSPELEKRCEKETGEDWPKIAHIPDITVKCRPENSSQRGSSMFTRGLFRLLGK